MKQVFYNEPVNLDSTIHLDDGQAHHIFDVLRTTEKEAIRVVSDGEVYLARTLQKPLLYVFGREEVQPRLVDVTLCASLIKSDKWEWMLQKAAELGVSRIVPFVSNYSIIRLDDKKAAKKLERWQAILEAAARQCNRHDKVLLEPIQTIQTLPEFKSKCNLVAYEKEDGSSHIANFLQYHPESVTIVIGPEGGFDRREIDILQNNGFIPVSLGNLILRAETAACYVLCAVEYQSHLPSIQECS